MKIVKEKKNIEKKNRNRQPKKTVVASTNTSTIETTFCLKAKSD